MRPACTGRPTGSSSATWLTTRDRLSQRPCRWAGRLPHDQVERSPPSSPACSRGPPAQRLAPGGQDLGRIRAVTAACGRRGHDRRRPGCRGGHRAVADPTKGRSRRPAGFPPAARAARRPPRPFRSAGRAGEGKRRDDHPARHECGRHLHPQARSSRVPRTHAERSPHADGLPPGGPRGRDSHPAPGRPR